MDIQIIEKIFVVCKVETIKEVEIKGDYYFISKTDKEISVVCEASFLPAGATDTEENWRAFRIAGTMDFALIGVIAEFSDILAKQKISLFVISTYDTDYVLIKAEKFRNAINALKSYGYNII